MRKVPFAIPTKQESGIIFIGALFSGDGIWMQRRLLSFHFLEVQT